LRLAVSNTVCAHRLEARALPLRKNKKGMGQP